MANNDIAGVLEAAVPILPATNLAVSLDYYQRVLGFHIGWTSGEPPFLASVCRDRVEVNLSLSSELRPARGRAYFSMKGVDAYYERITAAGARVAVPIADRPYGMRDFRIIDPDANELSFGEDISDRT